MEMSDSADVRVVRCPNCENLLPEVTDYSVYQCGGCGAVLKAMGKGVDLDKVYEKCDEEIIEGSIEKHSDRYEKKMSTRSNDGSESDTRSTVSSSRRADCETMMILRGKGESRRTRMTTGQDEQWDHAAVPDDDVFRDYKRSAELHRVKAAQYYGHPYTYHESDHGLTTHRKPGASDPVSKFGNNYENPAYGFSDVGDERAEILRKLDELTDHLSQSRSLTGKGKGKAPHDRRTSHQDHYASDNWYSDEPSEMNSRVPMQNPYRDPQYRRQPYPNQYAEPPPAMYIGRHEMGAEGFYPPRHVPSGYRSGPHQPYHMMPPHRVFKSGPYTDDGTMMYMDTMEPYPPKFIRHHHHHLSCSCYQCRSDNYSEVNYHVNLSRDGSRDSDHRFFPEGPRPLKSHNAQSHSRWSSDMSLEADSNFTTSGPTRIRLPSGGTKYHPVAGGAPFLTCNNCFVLLLFPEKVWMNGNKKRNQMRCGSCSTVIVLAVSDNKLVISCEADPKGNYVNPDKNGHGRVDHVRTAFSSVDYDSNSGYEIKTRHSTSETEVAYESSVADLSKDDNVQRPSVGLSLQDHFEYSNKYHRQSDKDEKVIPDKNISSKQISRTRNESSATEIDLSTNEYSNTGTTFDSGEGSREGERLKSSSAAKSFFASVGLSDEPRKSDEAIEQEKANVTVNGHLISGRVIRKAEKLSGPIHPGNYWYDFRAGFWGAIGGPCLGIIPPFIEEFNYPMPERCAGGNTHIFVNGRELNQKDLNLLGGRGLPTERDRSYIVEISGRVLEEDTGEELESLGKLAPSVERARRGFGMRAPKAVA